MSGPLIIGVPSKGRLQENANSFFARAGLVVRQMGGARGYMGSFAGLDGVEIAFLSASEIARNLASGAIHLGVTGEDLIRESIADADRVIEIITPLGFGHANVVVAVPQSWIDVASMADLDDVAAAFYARRRTRMRVATKYINLTRAFFANHGIADYRIVESLGATEGAPGAGSAELIVDITTTGATLAANALKVLDDGVILKSEANLVASVSADWNQTARAALGEVLARVAAEARARSMREVRFAFAGDAAVLLQAAARDHAAVAPFGTAPGATITLHCPQSALYGLIAQLKAAGVTTLSVARLDYVFEADSPLFAKLARRMGWA